jgi:hypothetical protein
MIEPRNQSIAKLVSFAAYYFSSEINPGVGDYNVSSGLL